MIEINTARILFIVGGAFIGLEDVVQDRINQSSSVGFNAELRVSADQADKNKILEKVQHKDLIKYGMIPEFMGRFPVLTVLRDLTKEELIQVLTQPRNAITKQFQKLFELNGITLEFTDSAYDSLAQKVMDMELGARGLRSIIETVLLDTQYGISILEDDGVVKIIINDKFINEEEKPVYKYAKARRNKPNK
jgi:ATP-dependent Clp protease ATP-binding subunit ClpX